MQGVHPEISPREVFRDVKAHGFHLLEKTLRGILGGVEVDGELPFHGPPHDLLGDHALARIVLALDERERPHREAVGDLPVQLVVARGDDKELLLFWLFDFLVGGGGGHGVFVTLW